MKNSEEHPLLNELLTGQEVAEFRGASLREALTVLHRTRRRRKVLRRAALAALPVLLVVVAVISKSMNSSSPDLAVVNPPAIASAAEQARPSSIQFISDEELLALFPNQPLALVGPEGQQELVFLNQALPN